jgi:hypothetical protein
LKSLDIYPRIHHQQNTSDDRRRCSFWGKVIAERMPFAERHSYIRHLFS